MHDGGGDFVMIHCVCADAKCYCMQRAKIPSNGRLARKIRAGAMDYEFPCPDCALGKHKYALNEFETLDAAYGVVNDIFSVTKPKMERAHAAVMVINDRPDGKLSMEMGLALLLGKPIILVVIGNTPISDKIMAAADEVLYFKEFNAEAISAAVAEAYKQIGTKKPN